jgi:hypothetical protein
MTMSSHFETLSASFAHPDYYGPGAEIGDDTVPAGMYAIGLNLGDGGAFIVGTVAEHVELGVQYALAVAGIQAADAKPLTLDDFDWDGEDHTFTCPRCDAFFEPDTDVMALVHEIQNHIKQQHPTTDLSVE